MLASLIPNARFAAVTGRNVVQGRYLLLLRDWHSARVCRETTVRP